MNETVLEKTLDQMANHMEFLGYTIEKNEPTQSDEKNMILARHSTLNNVIVLEVLPKFFFFTAQLTTTKKPSATIDQFLLNATGKSDITKFYYKVENSEVVIVCETYYTGEYVKDVFAKFIELMQNDHKRLSMFEGFDKVFL